jgi:energy-coupling factor transporter ATP-binding protein EcfA2
MLAAYPMFTLALAEILKERGLYAVHAACPAAGNRALLLAGTSGCGKSTLALAFARRGHPLLSDDTVFVDQPGTTVYAFPDEIDVTDTTAAMFGELRVLAAQAKRPGREKHAVAIDHFGAPAPRRCPPAAIVLIHPNRSGLSRLTRVDGARALHELAANVLLTDAASSQRHLDALGALARGLPAYALSTGRDLDHAVDLLEPLFAADQEST